MNSFSDNLMTTPNILTGIRFAIAPILLLLAWNGYPRVFLVVLMLSFLTDVLDGYLARSLGQETQLGSMLDTWADVVIYITMPISAWWLWPEIMRQEAPFVVLAVMSFVLPAVVGIVKFGSFTHYHTWGVKIAAICVGTSVTIAFAGGPTWPFRLATPICILAALEQMAITFVLSKSRSNVRSLWHVLKEIRGN
jgi:CDP-diacylglycerol--glycerol-3-phosphate 3-phosphatidyltransferase